MKNITKIYIKNKKKKRISRKGVDQVLWTEGVGLIKAGRYSEALNFLDQGTYGHGPIVKNKNKNRAHKRLLDYNLWIKMEVRFVVWKKEIQIR